MLPKLFFFHRESERGLVTTLPRKTVPWSQADGRMLNRAWFGRKKTLRVCKRERERERERERGFICFAELGQFTLVELKKNESIYFLCTGWQAPLQRKGHKPGVPIKQKRISWCNSSSQCNQKALTKIGTVSATKLWTRLSDPSWAHQASNLNRECETIPSRHWKRRKRVGSLKIKLRRVPRIRDRRQAEQRKEYSLLWRRLGRSTYHKKMEITKIVMFG